MNIAADVKSYIRKNNLLSPGDKVILGVSGGPDSIALLFIMNHIKHDLGVQLHIAHYNHQLRATAGRDQVFVENVARSLNISCSIGKSRSLKNKKTGSLEEAARLERLNFFKKVKQKTGFPIVALAHNQDDLAETVLMRIIRGSGLQGLRAIQARSEIDGLSVIRPFLELTRKKIIEYLDQNKIPYKTDPTNLQLKFFRNKIRLKLLPLLEKEYNPNIKESLVNLSQTLNTDFDFLKTMTNEVYAQVCSFDQKGRTIRVDGIKLKIQPDSLRRMLYRSVYLNLKGNTNLLEQKHILAIDDLLYSMPEGSVVHWPFRIKVEKINRSLLFSIKE